MPPFYQHLAHKIPALFAISKGGDFSFIVSNINSGAAGFDITNFFRHKTIKSSAKIPQNWSFSPLKAKIWLQTFLQTLASLSTAMLSWLLPAIIFEGKFFSKTGASRLEGTT